MKVRLHVQHNRSRAHLPLSLQAIPIQHTLIRDISAVRVYMPDELRTREARLSVLASVQDLQLRYPSGLPLLDPIKDMNIHSAEMISHMKQYSILQTRLQEHPLSSHPQLKSIYERYERKANMEKQVIDAKNELKKAQSLLQIGDLKRYKRVLRRLGYCNSADVIDLKGRVACEIDTGDELVTTELLFNGVFNELTVSQACALLSCFVFQEKANEMPKLPPELSEPLRRMQVSDGSNSKMIESICHSRKLPVVSLVSRLKAKSKWTKNAMSMDSSPTWWMWSKHGSRDRVFRISARQPPFSKVGNKKIDQSVTS